MHPNAGELTKNIEGVDFLFINAITYQRLLENIVIIKDSPVHIVNFIVKIKIKQIKIWLIYYNNLIYYKWKQIMIIYLK